jgi:hypothetical protein
MEGEGLGVPPAVLEGEDMVVGIFFLLACLLFLLVFDGSTNNDLFLGKGNTPASSEH